MLRVADDGPLTIDDVAREAAMSPFIHSPSAPCSARPRTSGGSKARLDRASISSRSAIARSPTSMEVGFSSLGSFSACSRAGSGPRHPSTVARFVEDGVTGNAPRS